MSIAIRTARTEADFIVARALADRMARWDAAMSKAAGFMSEDVFAAYYAEDARELHATLSGPGSAMLIAYDGERPIGSVGYARLSETACEVQKFFVLEDARGKGAGGMLLEDLFACMAADGYARACLETATFMTDAIALYRRVGFRTCPPFRLSPLGQTALSVFMERTLQ